MPRPYGALAAVLGALTLSSAVSALYSPSDGVVTLGQAGFQREVLGSPEVVLAEFFAPWCGHCQRLVPDYKKAAQSLKGLVKTVAIDCDDAANRGLCSAQGIQGFPTIKVFSPTPDKSDKTKFKKITSDYQGARSADAMSDFAISKLPTFLVNRIGTSGVSLEQFLEDRPSLPRAVLVSNRKATPPLWKALSTQFHNRIVFGEARSDGDSVASEAIAKWGVTDFPGVILYPTNETEFVKYDGQMKHAALTQFFAKYAPSSKSSKGSDQEPKKPEEERPPFDPNVYEVTDQAALDKYLATPGITVVAFVNLEPEYEESVAAQKASVEMLAKLKEKFYKRNGPFGSFVWINAIERGRKLMNDFSVSDMLPSLMIIHDKKKVYRVHREAFELESVHGFLGEVWQGKGRFFKYDFPPKLDAAKKEKGVAKDEL
ncbi:hypothetical protein DFJ74DRAFT_675686 [Hyaloraphidium curvatum]|nr:hypothetical protein DFJ74DRAFT_675686 [Hyaloraphidium curvatum]